MAPRRPIEDAAPGRDSQKRRGGFKVGPDNLPDGPWRRKVIKIKKDLIHQAKIKKEYAKLKSREPPIDKPFPPSDHGSEASWEPEAEKEEQAPPSQELHPDRQALLDKPRSPTPEPPSRTSHHVPNPNVDHASYPKSHHRDARGNRKPQYFSKEMEMAEKARAEAKARREEWERNQAEKKRKIEERERRRRAMAKARSGGSNGQRKLGRESGVLLEKIRRLVGEK